MSFQNEWDVFINQIVREFGSGSTEIEISEKYGETEVEWIGQISEVLLDDPPAIRVNMPDAKVDLADGREVLVNYLCLNVEPGDIETWRQVPLGNTVQFLTILSKGNAVFPGIQWADWSDGRATILIGTYRSRLRRIL